ncbi:hypothetical protein FACS189499_09570 [Clostridia bacterium]|nr:hypothetical protein FACS189499_09570 [Clostridia bacterium]
MSAFDFKKEQKDLYAPKKPSIIDIPKMTFIMIDGEGDPNTAEAYKNAVEILYGLSYAIKMSKNSNNQPVGYFDFVVPPLEGLWRSKDDNFDIFNFNKSDFQWTSMLRQPDFVTESVFSQAKETFAKKKQNLDLSFARLCVFAEGLTAQIMHIGSYDDEPNTITKLNDFIAQNGYKLDFSEKRLHHEIYLGDPRKTAPEKLKTIIRHPIVN